MKVTISDRARRFLDKLTNAKLKLRLENKILSLENHPSISNVEKIQGSSISYRVRVGDYRILYDYDGRSICVLDVGHRREIYR